MSLSSSWAHVGLILSGSKRSWKTAHPIAPLRESLLNSLDFSPLPQTSKVGVTPHCTSTLRPFTTSLYLNLGSPGPLGQDLRSSTQLALLTSIFILISTALHSQFQTQLTWPPPSTSQQNRRLCP